MKTVKSFSLDSEVYASFSTIVAHNKKSFIIEELMKEYVQKQRTVKRQFTKKERGELMQTFDSSSNKFLLPDCVQKAKYLTNIEYGVDLLTTFLPKDWNQEKKEAYKKRWQELTKKEIEKVTTKQKEKEGK